MTSKHYDNDGKQREAAIKRIGGDGIDFQEFIVNHEGREQIHVVTTNAIIKVIDPYTKKLVTKLIARPGQIRRYYRDSWLKMPYDIIDKAREHEKAGLNRA